MVFLAFFFCGSSLSSPKSSAYSGDPHFRAGFLVETSVGGVLAVGLTNVLKSGLVV